MHPSPVKPLLSQEAKRQCCLAERDRLRCGRPGREREAAGPGARRRTDRRERPEPCRACRRTPSPAAARQNLPFRLKAKQVAG